MSIDKPTSKAIAEHAEMCRVDQQELAREKLGLPPILSTESVSVDSLELAIINVRSFILWAREQGLVLGEVHVGEVHVSLNDPRVNMATIPEPGEHDDAEDRGHEDRPTNYYDQHARSRTPGKKMPR